MVMVVLVTQLGLIGTAGHRVVMMVMMMVIVIVMGAGGCDGSSVLVIGVVPKRINFPLLMLFR
jgi:hypothetical protein